MYGLNQTHRKLYYFDFHNYAFSILKNGVLNIDMIVINDRILPKATGETKTKNIRIGNLQISMLGLPSFIAFKNSFEKIQCLQQFKLISTVSK